MNINTKEYIIDESYKLFLGKNYEAVSISIISEAIGLTKGALYHHFKNKEELFKAVVDKYITIIPINQDVQNLSLLEFIELLITHTTKTLRSIFHNDVEFNPVNYMALITDCFRHYKGFAEEKMKILENEVKLIKKVLENAIARGEIRPDINTAVIANQYFSTLLGMAGDILRNSSLKLTIKSLRDQFSELYKLLKI